MSEVAALRKAFFRGKGAKGGEENGKKEAERRQQGGGTSTEQGSWGESLGFKKERVNNVKS